MKRLLLAYLAALPLASCGPVNGSSNGLAGDPDDYYEIKYYSDYNGIDYLHPDPSLATYVGHAYVKKDAESRVAVLSEQDKDFKPCTLAEIEDAELQAFLSRLHDKD